MSLWSLAKKDLKEKAVKIFNKWIRSRDCDERCISCAGRVEHACHFFSADKYWWLRFHPVNVNGGCRECNFYKHPVQDSVPKFYDLHYNGLVNKHGIEAVEELIELSKVEPDEKAEKELYISVIETYR